MNQVQKLVYGMLTENTGKAMCDSGFSEGRGWQINQKKTIEDFNNEEMEVYEFDWERGDIMRTVSVFHYLTNNLQLDDLCDEFNEIQEESDDWNAECESYGVSRNAFDHINSFENDVIEDRVFNTYNGESDLSQILQGANLTINDEAYFLVQIHNGADARGGYTDAKLFKYDEHCEGIVHEFLSEYKDDYDINEDMKEGYITEFVDHMDSSKKYTLEEVRNQLEILE
jgi:hypothetical protein